MGFHFSLHKTKTQKECDLCGCQIPVRKLPDYAEYWRIKGGKRDANTPRIVCCLCHAIYGFPTDGWVTAPDGRETIAAVIPAQA